MSGASGRPGVPAPRVPTEDGASAARRPRQVLSGLFPVALVVAGLVWLLPRFADVSAVGDALRGMTALEVSTLVAMTLWNLATYGFVMTTTMPGLTWRQAMVVTESATAVSNTLPAGAAVSVGVTYGMFGSWGFSRSRGTVSLLLSGLWNTFAKLGLPVLALALLALQGDASPARTALGLAGIGGLALALAAGALTLRSDATARRVGRGLAAAVSRLVGLLGRAPVTGWDRALATFRARTVTLLRARWHWLTLATLVSHVSLFAVLLLALRHVGVSETEVAWVEVLAVFAFARLLTAVPLTPGGVGVVEVALIAGLVAAGGPRAEVVAAVLAFRALTYVLPIPLGFATYAWWRRNTSWRRPAGTAPRTPLVPEAV